MNKTIPKPGDVATFDGKHVVHVVTVDDRSVAFERTDKPGRPIQIVNISTWQVRSCATTTQASQEAKQLMKRSFKPRKLIRRPRLGAAVPAPR